MLNFVFYIIVVFVVLFGLFVGIYFYKYCIKCNMFVSKMVDLFVS